MTGEKNPNPTPEQPQNGEQVSSPSQLKRVLAISGLVLTGALMGGLVVEAAGSGDSKNEKSGDKQAQTSDDGEYDVTLTDSVEGLVPGKFLPRTETGKITSKKEAEAYSLSLFNENGPLAGETNRCSLSAMDAAVVAVGTSNQTNNEYSYVEQFNKDMGFLNSTGAETFGQNLSDKSSVFLGSNGNFEAHAMGNGQLAIELVPVMEEGVCTGMKLVQVTINEDTPALVYKLQGDKTLELNGVEVSLRAYSEVVLPGNGSILIPGALPKPEPTKEKGPNKKPNGKDKGEEKAPAGNQPDTTQTPNGSNNHTSNNNGGSNTGNNANNSPGTGTGGGSNETTGECGGCGNGPGGGGGTTGPTPGPNPGGGGGGETPGPEEPTPEPGKPVDPGLRSSATIKSNVTYSY
jgi:hypothetical protein